MLPPALRKAAVLISALDTDAAEALLRQMSDEDSAKVRSALMELDDISADEQQRVLAEFARRQGGGSSRADETDDVELQLDPAVEAAAATRPASPTRLPPETTTDDISLNFLNEVDAKAIAGLLCREHPQIAAVVITQLTPQHAAAVLQELPAPLATEALERIAWLDELTPEVLADLARELRRQLAPHRNTSKSGQAAMAHVSAVLEAMNYSHRQRLVLQLADRNASLLHRLGVNSVADQPQVEQSHAIAPLYRLDSERIQPVVSRQSLAEQTPPVAEAAYVTFDQLTLLDDAALRNIFAAADPEIALLALTGAEPRFINRILRKLPARDAAIVRQRLEHPGPLRLRDVEQAQAALAAVASRLAHEGIIALPSAARFAAAV